MHYYSLPKRCSTVITLLKDRLCLYLPGALSDLLLSKEMFKGLEHNNKTNNINSATIMPE